MKNHNLNLFLLMAIIIVINIPGVLAQSTFYSGIDCGLELDQYGYAYKNGKHYLVWSNGRFSSNTLYSNIDNFVKLSTSTDGLNWTTDDLIPTTYGSYNLKIAIDNYDKIHIVYTQPTQVSTPEWGPSAADVVYLTNSSGIWDKQIVASGSGYIYYASDLITIGTDEKISVFYHSDFWWRHGAPLLVKKYNGTNWENEITVANYGILNNCDDKSNIFKGYDIENNHLVLYVSNGFYFDRCWGTSFYSDKIFKIVENGDNYSLVQTFEDVRDINVNNGNLLKISGDQKSIYLNDILVYSNENFKIEKPFVDKTGTFISFSNGNDTYLFKKIGLSFELFEVLNNKSCMLLNNEKFIFSNWSQNPKTIWVYPINFDVNTDFWKSHTSGGIAVKVIETARTETVQYVGYEYKNILGSKIIKKFSASPEFKSFFFLSDFPSGINVSERFNKNIILYDKDHNKIGHIPFNYNPNYEQSKSRQAILFFHNDEDMCTDGNFDYFPFDNKREESPPSYKNQRWDYFSKGEFPVSMLIPPGDKMPDIFDKIPALFVHGVEGTYPYWKPEVYGGNSTVDLFNGKKDYHGWQFYYPKNMDIFHSSKCLNYDLKYLSDTYYNSRKINIITHSMGGLVTSEFTTLYSVTAHTYVEKILMTVPPIHGSLGSNLHYKAGLGYFSQLLLSMDREAPCYMDMSLGSEFMMNLHSRNWNECFDFDSDGELSDNIFVLIGTTKKNYKSELIIAAKGRIAEEALEHNDIIVAISSASLLDHGIGFATMYGNHNDGKFNSNIEKFDFLPNFIKTYFKSTDYEGFINTIKEDNSIQAIVDSNKQIKKPSYLQGKTLEKLKTDEEGVDYQKGIITFEYPESNIDEFSVYTDPEKETLLLADFSNMEIPKKGYGSQIGKFNRNKYSKIYYFSSEDGCALKLHEGNITLKTDFLFNPNTSKIFDFNNCQTSHFTLESNLLASNNNGQSIIKKAFLKFFPSQKNAFIQSSSAETNSDTVIYVDDQTDAVNFTLQSWEADENGIPITMKMKMPDGTVIDPTSAGITYSLDTIAGMHQMLVNNPMIGSWHIWAESNNPGVDTMQYIARAYFLSDIIAYSYNDSNQIIAGENYDLITGLKVNDLSLLDTTNIKIIATVTSPLNISNIYDLSDNLVVNDTSFIYNGTIPIDTIGYYTVEIAFEGIYNGIRFERQVVLQVEGLDNKVYFNLPFVELNENNNFSELKLSNYIQSSSGSYDTISFSQRIITSTLDTSIYKVILDSLQRSVIMYSDISDTGRVEIEYAFRTIDNGEMRDTLLLFVNQVYPHPIINSSQTEICRGDSVTFSVTGADTYLWSTNDTTNLVTVKPISTTVYYLTSFRNGYFVKDSITIVINPLPNFAGEIEGEITITRGQSGIKYSVPPIENATSYTWTLPFGAIGSSNADTILVSFGENAVSGEIKVKGQNECGEGEEISLPITVLSCNKQSMNFAVGWNIFSLPVIPDSTNMKFHFRQVIDRSSLVKIQDESGNSLEDWGIFGGWKNNIGNISPTEGYKIKVNVADSIEICGTPVDYPFAIPLKSGWNITGYPHQTAYNGMSLVQQLIAKGTLIKVQDEGGNSIEDWGIFGSWKNNIGNFMPGEGYKIKVSADDTLWIYENYPKSSAVLPEIAATSHFQTAFTGNGLDHMNINLINLAESGIMEGDEIGIFDGNICVGSAKIVNRNSIGIPVSASDGINGKNGYAEGNTITLKLYRNGREYPLTIQPINQGKTVFEKGESLFAIVDLATGLEGIPVSGLTEIKVYPNPTTGMVNIEFTGTGRKTEVLVTNLVGAEIFRKEITDAANYQIDLSNQGSGVYLLKISNNNRQYINKIVLSKQK